MGHQVTENDLIVDDTKIRTIRDSPVPKEKKVVQPRLGMCNFLSQFVAKFSEICAPLREISNMNAEIFLSASNQNALTHIIKK